MAMKTMVTCVKTDDLQSVKDHYSSNRYLVQKAAGPYVCVWQPEEFKSESGYHHLAPDAGRRWGEAFYVGTDDVTSCLSFARYSEGQLVRSIYYLDVEGQVMWESRGPQEPWESHFGVPATHTPGIPLPPGEQLFYAILNFYECPIRPERRTA